MKHDEHTELRLCHDQQYRNLRATLTTAVATLAEFSHRVQSMIDEGLIIQGDAGWLSLQTQEGDSIREQVEDAQEALTRYTRFRLKEFEIDDQEH